MKSVLTRGTPLQGLGQEMPQSESSTIPSEGQSGSAGIPLFLTISILAVILLSVFNPEHIKVNGGYGWDGFYIYKAVLLHPALFFQQHLDSYVIQRSLPFMIMHYAMSLLHLKFTDANVVGAFLVYQALALSVCIFLWWKISDELKLGVNGRWLGLMGMVVNYAMLKVPFYNPVLCDSAALMLGMTSFYFYLRGDTLKLLFISLCTLMVWPTGILFNIFLLAFPRTHDALALLPGKLSQIAVVGICAIALGVFSYFDYTPFSHPSNIVQPIKWLLPVSLATAIAFLYVALNQLICRTPNPLTQIPTALRRIGVLRISCILILIAAYLFLTRVMVSNVIPVFSAEGFLRNFTYSATSRPGLFIPGQYVFWGPIVILIGLRFKTYCQQAASLGTGAFLALIFTLGLSLFSEGRALCNLYIFIVAPMALVLDKLPLKKDFALKFFAVSLLSSTIWLPNNSPDASITEPSKFYYMHFGPWMSNSMYLLVSAAVIVLTVYLWLELREDAGSTLSSEKPCISD